VPSPGCKGFGPFGGRWSVKRIRARGLDVEQELRALRPQPREELARALAARMQASTRARSQSTPLRGNAFRVALGSGVTALFVAALVPAGGLGYASGAVSRAASAVERTVTHTIRDPQRPPSNSSGPNKPASPAASPSQAGDHPAHHPTSGQHEYGIPICHHSHGSFVEIHVSREALPAHLTHDDIIPAPRNGCPRH
jgi:hypothetical protein